MRLYSLFRVLVPRVAFRRAAQVVLARAMPSTKAARLWEATEQQQALLRQARPRHTAGVNLLLRYMVWDLALYRAATADGLSPAAAGRLVEEVNWHVFGPSTAAAFAASRLRSTRLQTRLRWLLDLLFRTLFTAPFEREEQPLAHGVAFDVTVCPLARYFQAQGVPELTYHAACSMDHRMAAAWGIPFERTQTLAQGHARCDFRYPLGPPADASIGLSLEQRLPEAEP